MAISLCLHLRCGKGRAWGFSRAWGNRRGGAGRGGAGRGGGGGIGIALGIALGIEEERERYKGTMLDDARKKSAMSASKPGFSGASVTATVALPSGLFINLSLSL